MRIGLDTVDEGTFENGKWIPQRRLNGDEVHESAVSGTGVKLSGRQISIQKVSLYSYK